MIAEAQLGLLLACEKSAPSPSLDNGKLRRALRLALEKIDHGCDGIELKWLVGIKLKLHGRRSDGLEAGDTFGLKGLHRVGFKLVIRRKALVETDNALRTPAWPSRG